MKNVYQIGSGDLTFDIIERIINEKPGDEGNHSEQRKVFR